MRSTRLIRGGLAALLMPIALLTACAGPGSNTPSRNAEGQTIVRFQDPGVLLSALPVLQAKETGAFAANGIELQSNAPLYNANQIVQSLLQGQADIAVGGGTAALAAVAQGQQVRIIAVLGAPAPLQVTLTKKTITELAARGVTPASPVDQKLAALRGMSFSLAASGSTVDQMFRYLLTNAGVSPDRDAVLQPFPDTASIIAAARQGTVNGMVGVPATSITPVTDGWGEVFIDFATEAPQTVDMPYLVAMSTPQYIEKNPDAVRGFLRAIQQAKTQSETLPPEARNKLHTSFFPDMSQATFDKSVDSIIPGLRTPLTPTEQQHELMLKMVGTGPTGQADVKFDQLYDTAIISSVEPR